jgi:hypothetical protein
MERPRRPAGLSHATSSLPGAALLLSISTGLQRQRQQAPLCSAQSG